MPILRPTTRARLAMAASSAILAAALATPAVAATVDTSALQRQVDSLQQQLDAMKASAPAASKDDADMLRKYMDGKTSLTWHGVTLYGTVDVGMSYQNHGAPLSNVFYTGSNEMLQKNSLHSEWGMTPSGLSQSKIGIKFDEPVYRGLHVVGKLETGFNPQSGTLADAIKSVQQNNGVALANQTANADGGRAGQLFNAEAYVGVQSHTFGRLTVGRHNDLFNGNVGAYDPMGGAYAFSPIGYSGFAAGAGNTENTRLDNSLRYSNTFGPVRFAALAQAPYYHSGSLGAYQFDLGTNWGGLSVDGAFSHINDSIHLGTFGTGTATILGVPNTPTLGNMTLNATVSDTTAEQALVKYAMKKATLFGGYEHIMYANPSHPLSAGATDIGGYILGAVNNTSFTTNLLENVFWTGAKYKIRPNWTVTGAYYYVMQNDHSGTGCGWSDKSGSCAGSQRFISAMTDYAFTKRFDIYGGVMYSHYEGGMVAGYKFNNAISPMIGARFNF